MAAKTKVVVVAAGRHSCKAWLDDIGVNPKDYQYVSEPEKLRGIERGTIVAIILPGAERHHEYELIMSMLEDRHAQIRRVTS